jgi:hypothetical protein
MELEPVTEFELELTRAMRCVEAPTGFAEDVMARAERKPVRSKLLVMPVRPRRVWATGAVAALIVMGALQGERVHQRREQARTARVEQQFETAMRITDQALAQTRGQLKRAGVQLQPTSSQE